MNSALKFIASYQQPGIIIRVITVFPVAHYRKRMFHSIQIRALSKGDFLVTQNPDDSKRLQNAVLCARQNHCAVNSQLCSCWHMSRASNSQGMGESQVIASLPEQLLVMDDCWGRNIRCYQLCTPGESTSLLWIAELPRSSREPWLNSVAQNKPKECVSTKESAGN